MSQTDKVIWERVKEHRGKAPADKYKGIVYYFDQIMWLCLLDTQLIIKSTTNKYY